MPAHAASSPDAEGATSTGRAFGVSRSRIVAWILSAVLVGMIVLHAVAYETFTVPSGSMEPTFVPGDRIVVDKLAHTPKRGQIVVFTGTGSLNQDREPTGFRGAVDDALRGLGFRLDERDYLKRIIAIGGEQVSVGADGVLRVDGRVVPESYLSPGVKASTEPFTVTVPRGKVFVMGDNREKSNDSRNHLGDPGGGFVPVEKIVGAVSWRYWHG